MPAFPHRSSSNRHLAAPCLPPARLQVYLADWGTIPVAVKVLLVPGTAGANLAEPGAAQEALALPPSALAELEAEAGLLASLRWVLGWPHRRGPLSLLRMPALAACAASAPASRAAPRRPIAHVQLSLPNTSLKPPMHGQLLWGYPQPARAGD